MRVFVRARHAHLTFFSMPLLISFIEATGHKTDTSPQSCSGSRGSRCNDVIFKGAINKSVATAGEGDGVFLHSSLWTYGHQHALPPGGRLCLCDPRAERHQRREKSHRAREKHLLDSIAAKPTIHGRLKSELFWFGFVFPFVSFFFVFFVFVYYFVSFLLRLLLRLLRLRLLLRLLRQRGGSIRGWDVSASTPMHVRMGRKECRQKNLNPPLFPPWVANLARGWFLHQLHLSFVRPSSRCCCWQPTGSSYPCKISLRTLLSGSTLCSVLILTLSSSFSVLFLLEVKCQRSLFAHTRACNMPQAWALSDKTRLGETSCTTLSFLYAFSDLYHCVVSYRNRH